MLSGRAAELNKLFADKLSYPQYGSSWNLADLGFLRGFVPRDAESILTAFLDNSSTHRPSKVRHQSVDRDCCRETVAVCSTRAVPDVCCPGG